MTICRFGLIPHWLRQQYNRFLRAGEYCRVHVRKDGSVTVMPWAMSISLSVRGGC